MSEKKNIHAEIITRAVKDDNFKKILNENPVETIKKTLGLEIPQGIDIKVMEDTDSLKHLVLPCVDNQPVEIDDRELELISGSKFTLVYTICYCL